MAPDIFSRILVNLEPHVGSIRVAVLYHGGEPLLNKQLPQMVKSIRSLGIPFVKTVSNGMLMNEAVAHALIESGLGAIEFSLDGQSAAENNFFRRNSDYDRVVGNIKSFLDVRRKTGADQLEVYLASTQFIQRPEDILGAPEAPSHLLSEFGKYKGEIGFKCTWAMEWPHMAVNREIFSLVEHAGLAPSHERHCDNVLSTMTVRWNGDIVPCCFDLTSRVVLGNVNEADLLSIWQGGKYHRLRLAIQTGTPARLCAKCNVIRRPGVYLMVKQRDLAETN